MLIILYCTCLTCMFLGGESSNFTYFTKPNNCAGPTKILLRFRKFFKHNLLLSICKFLLFLPYIFSNTIFVDFSKTCWGISILIKYFRQTLYKEQNANFVLNRLFFLNRKSCRLRYNVEEYNTARQATDDYATLCKRNAV